MKFNIQPTSFPATVKRSWQAQHILLGESFKIYIFIMLSHYLIKPSRSSKVEPREILILLLKHTEELSGAGVRAQSLVGTSFI